MIALNILLHNTNCQFLSTCYDSGDRCKQFIRPGSGTLVKFIEHATNQSNIRKTKTLGKPDTIGIELIKSKLEVIDSTQCVMVGDRLNADISMGCQAGVNTILVESGVHSAKDVGNFEYKPDFIFKSLKDVMDYI